MARILSIEDDPDFQHLIALTLQNQGYEVHYAFTGQEGYEKILALDPDLILLDMMLPLLNGAEVIKLVKKNKATRDIPIIAMTARYDEVDFFESSIKALGVVAYIRKPVQVDELLSVMRRALAGRGAKGPAVSFRKGAVRIDSKSRTVWINDKLIANLPSRRFETLFLLMQTNAEVPWKELVQKIWGPQGAKNDLEKAIQRLRADLGPEKHRIRTTRRGYELTG